jgi:hypothetical protein
MLPAEEGSFKSCDGNSAETRAVAVLSPYLVVIPILESCEVGVRDLESAGESISRNTMLSVTRMTLSRLI